MVIAFYLGVLFEFHLGPTLDAGIAPLMFSRSSRGLDFDTLGEIWRVMQHRYARKDLSADDAFNGAAKGLVHLFLEGRYGDAFSTYFTPDELRQQNERLAGQFGGIGANIEIKDGKLLVTSVLANNPAARAGIRGGDIVTRIEGTDVAGLTVDAAVGRIHGPSGSHVHLAVLRGTQTLQFDLVRANIVVPSVRSKTIVSGVLYVRIYEFGEHTADDFDKALRDGIAARDSMIVLDLRRNPGGFVDKADTVISEFVSSGQSVVLVGRDGTREEHKVSGQGVAFSQKLVVLVDEGTASASEIVAGAFKDHHRAAALVGKKTFGKGLVEEDFRLRNGGDVHLTIAYWYTPSGHSIQGNGITPDVDVGLAAADDMYEVDVPSSDPRKDAQLQAALTAIRKPR